jgi:hypothetical protein
MKRLLAFLFLLLLASEVRAATSGYVIRDDCTTIPDPAPYMIACLNSGDSGSLEQGQFYSHDGEDWFILSGSAVSTRTFDEIFDTDTDPTISGATEAKPFMICGNDTNYCIVLRVTTSNSPEVVGMCNGTIGGCDRAFSHNAGKKTCFLDSDGNEEVCYLEDSGFTKFTVDAEAQGNISYFNGTRWAALAPGSAGQRLMSGGAAANVSWANVSETKSFEVAACQAGVASHIWNTPSSNAPAATCDAVDTNMGTADFDATTDESIEMSFKLPGDWVSGSSIDVNFIWKAAATSGAVGWCLQVARTADAAVSSTSFAAQAAGNCVSDTVKGTTLQENLASITGVTCTSCAAHDRLKLRVSRDANGGAVTDSMTGDAKLILVELIYRRRPTS